MSKINIITCDCGNQIEKRYHDGLLRQEVKPDDIKEYYLWQCQECGNSWKEYKKEPIEITK